mmetsp:Transcript_8586/g.14285  ORF Transcript_8586/g.14285 Transcript_8586/m.14285 type:complete len:245 (+) Transcript_8586:92-826(+)|eukprot:CAMPEP_0119012336 /NCGR_PEP_ID=MMETSP1176-20130426/6416_1 /TAXON_ID=265551 /ORGANISM="Synedropsis recta cf, Strain CCMP1620" /LENGTH=244 /DNA_ID=CAMNT_0006965271 /DNA_START=92 /DNA_END=826 /DNA_ORIENTATION=+
MPNNSSRRPPMVDVPRSVMVTDKKPKHQKRSKPSPGKPEHHRSPVSVTSEASSVTEASMYRSEEEEEEHGEHQTMITEEQSASAKELLAYAAIRVQHQRLKEELKAAKASMSQKDEQIVQLTGQLRRAVASKCDLVVACTDMERQQERTAQFGTPESRQVKQQYLDILEGRADMEREFMNELGLLTEELCKTDRKYTNQLCDKDFSIGQLEEQTRRLTERVKEMELKERTAERTLSVRRSLADN